MPAAFMDWTFSKYSVYLHVGMRNRHRIMDYSHISSVIDYWGSFINRRQTKYGSLLCDPFLKGLMKEHEATLKAFDNSNAFTVFEIVSDLYYRENFHSDLIAFFLDPRRNHGYGSLGIELLIKLIAEQSSLGIDPSDYGQAEVIREQGRIDILIKDEVSKHAILLENKMNNAVDMVRQIPGYCDLLEEQGFRIDAAVYLPMLKYKTPDRSSWEEKDFRWLSKIVVIPAISGSNEPSLARDWLIPLAKRCDNIDVASTINQYVYLIDKTSNYNMDKISFDKLYDYLMEGDHLDSANSLVSVMHDLPKYLAQRIIDLYSDHCLPFTKMWPYHETDAVFEECMIDGTYFKMDVWCDTRTYNIIFWAPSDKNVSRLAQYNSIKDFLQEKGISIFDDYDISDKYKLSKHIPVSTPLSQFIDPILAGLRTISDK